MNKTELVGRIAREVGLTQAKAGEALEALLSAIRQALAAGEGVALIGLGRFSVTERAARQGRNLRTGETIEIPASRALKFKAARALKETVNR